MRIQRVHVQNFRSIYDATMECDSLTILVGANGAGKSSFLRALDVFYNPNAKIELHDFYNRNHSNPIRISVTYGDLSDAEQQAFCQYYHNNQLVVEKKIETTDDGKFSQRYYGKKQSNPEFSDVRNQSKAMDKRGKYDDLRNQVKYQSLPRATSATQVEEALAQWETDHPDACELLSSEYQFFGFKEVSAAKLEFYTRFLLVPAIRDASTDGEDARGSVISQLVDLVVRNTLADNQQVRQIKSEVKEKLQEISNLISLDTLKGELNTTMQRFAPNTAINLSWKDISFQFQDPQVDVQLEEDGYKSLIHYSGHGVQRTFIMTLLQHLAMTRIQSQNGTAPLSEEPNQQELMEGQAELAPQMNLILAIEEPELFQHPSRQRHFSSILRELATGSIPGVAEQTQVIYCTHSPLFVDIDQFENIRLIRKIQGTQQDTPQQTSVKKASIDQTIDRIKLSVMLTPAINEGFFAKMVILVEGTGDKAYLEMVARYCIKKPLETYGIVVISVDGKENLQKPLIVFPAFGIQVYPVWDNDKDKQGQSAEAKTIQSNRKILAACNCTEEDWPQGVHDAYAIFEPTLEHILEQEITSILAAGETWSSFMQTVKDTIQDDNLKRHAVVSQVVKQGYDKGCKFPLASQILNKVIECAGIL